MPHDPHIFLFSVHKDAMDAAVRAFAAEWPQARVSENLLDDSTLHMGARGGWCRARDV